ncbi:disease resistance protein RUN1-like [Argentina anserina]|uniref:disease resistance protein RUN1-like n=1 Tax=Argentina anserina TaxID=57926 RepID=UPI0021767C0B|nr:disease resistance protein RUN1-like [Potentilla anserina]
MACGGASSPAGSVIPTCGHDVFLSFRGRDTRLGFTYNLYKALDREKIKTFYDDRTLKRGENISAALLQAIELSKISLVICSENYGSSSWCLDELVKILECQESKKQIVIPPFYKVDPSHVRHQYGNFGRSFAGLKQIQRGQDPQMDGSSYTTTKLVWMDLLDGYESDFIEKIVEEISDVAGLYNQAFIDFEDGADLKNLEEEDGASRFETGHRTGEEYGLEGTLRHLNELYFQESQGGTPEKESSTEADSNLTSSVVERQYVCS